MKHYDVIVSARIELGGTFEADSIDEAVATATAELKSQGELSDVTVERALYIYQEEDTLS